MLASFVRSYISRITSNNQIILAMFLRLLKQKFTCLGGIMVPAIRFINSIADVAANICFVIVSYP